MLCNGLAPGHLPHAIVHHAEYRRVFGGVTFEAVQLKGEQRGMFRTVRSHGGYIYTLHLREQSLFVWECPMDSSSGEAQVDRALELLPCERSAPPRNVQMP